jgi:hypothetical protein
MISAVFSILAGLPLYLTNSEGVLLAALIVTNIVAAAPFGAAAAAMQEMSPFAHAGSGGRFARLHAQLRWLEPWPHRRRPPE